MKCPHCGQKRIPEKSNYCYHCGERLISTNGVSIMYQPNVEHFEMLKKGVTAWNNWRDAHPEVIPNLRRKNLSSQDFHNYNFHNAILNWANFQNTNCSYCDFSSAILHHADFTNSNLAYADFTNANLSDADFTGANLEEAKLEWSLSNRGTHFPNKDMDI